MAGLRRQFQFAKSNCGRTAGIGCGLGPETREWLLWRSSTFERRLADGGCTLEPVVGVAILKQIG